MKLSGKIVRFHRLRKHNVLFPALCFLLTLQARCYYVYDPDERPFLNLVLSNYLQAPLVNLVTPGGNGNSRLTKPHIFFSTDMAAGSLTAQSTAGTCSGTVQVSGDSFLTCVAATVSGGGKGFSVSPSQSLTGNTTYQVRVHIGATSANGIPLAEMHTSSGFTTQMDLADTPGFSLSDSDTTVTDGATGLIWKRCAQGKTGTTCAAAASTLSASGASTSCSSDTTAGRTWRLPGIFEIMLFADLTRGAVGTAAVNSTIFPGQDATVDFWTSTVSVSNSANNWYLTNIDRGGENATQSQATTEQVRCVSGNTIPAASFTDKANGTVYETHSNLLWTKCTLGSDGSPKNSTDFTSCQTPVVADRYDWIGARAACENLSFAGRDDWRLPRLRELLRLYDSSVSAGINTTFFPNTATTSYHSATQAKYDTTRNWIVSYLSPAGGGGSFTTGITGLMYVFCVADGQ